MPALTTTNLPFKKTGVLKLNDVYKLQICKLMRNTITGFDVDHNRFILAMLKISKTNILLLKDLERDMAKLLQVFGSLKLLKS